MKKGDDMVDTSNSFGEVTLLITHFNRSLSLERLLRFFDEQHIHFSEIIVSDDCSSDNHQKKLKQYEEKYGIRIITAEKNKGLANNINKGQRAVKSPFTLYIQEDFIPTGTFRQCLTDGIVLIKEYSDIDLVRFYSYRKYPYLKPLKYGFSEMRFHFWYPNAYQFNCYSDHPHLRRSNFSDKFGEYKEGIKSDRAEFKMVISFLQRKGKAVIHDDYQKLLQQENTTQEPSQVRRLKLKKQYQLSELFLIKIVRFVYRNIKFRFEYLFS